jgi:hypothetical protein
MLDARASAGMTEEGFAAWLKHFNLSEDYLLQCLELGQVALQRRKAKATEADKSFGMSITERRSELVHHGAEQREEPEPRQQELVQ